MYGYFHRQVFSICFIFAALWPFTYGEKFWKGNIELVTGWVVCCLIMSSFTVLPVVKEESLPLMFIPSFRKRLIIRQLAGVLMLSFGVWYLAFGTQWIARYRGGDDSNRSAGSTKSLITGVQVFLLGGCY